MKFFVTLLIFFSITQYSYAGMPDSIFGQPFSDGSPACSSCHSIAAAGYTASTWGPDISGLAEIIGDTPEGLLEFMKTSGISAMDAVYAGTTVSADELKELVQAFAALTPAQEDGAGTPVVLYAAILFVLLLGVGKLAFRSNSSLEENV